VSEGSAVAEEPPLADNELSRMAASDRGSVKALWRRWTGIDRVLASRLWELTCLDSSKARTGNGVRFHQSDTGSRHEAAVPYSGCYRFVAAIEPGVSGLENSYFGRNVARKLIRLMMNFSCRRLRRWRSVQHARPPAKRASVARPLRP
jgi:hypothetical protein